MAIIHQRNAMFRPHDLVHDDRHGWGEVIQIRFDSPFPIVVRFSDSFIKYSYTDKGSLHPNERPTLTKR